MLLFCFFLLAYLREQFWNTVNKSKGTRKRGNTLEFEKDCGLPMNGDHWSRICFYYVAIL